jgi:hypothetical protein
MVRYGEGFRMPASRDLSARAEGRRPKASQEGTARRGLTAERGCYDQRTSRHEVQRIVI